MWATITSLARAPAGVLIVSEALPEALLADAALLSLMPAEAESVGVGAAVPAGVLVAVLVEVVAGVLVAGGVIVGVDEGPGVGVGPLP
jgi:hypothetical protein